MVWRWLLLVLSAVTGAVQARIDGPLSEGGAGWLSQEQHWFNQTVDHFSPKVTRYFRQRYYEYLDHFDPASGPIFLIICGEAECKGIRNDYAAVLARHFHGALVALEHRYYGQSIPMSYVDLRTESLQYLSSKQAIADLASFRQYYQGVINERFTREREENAWVSIGISYAGALSAWFRLKFPHLVKAAISSSGVVHAILDYTAFDRQVAVSAGLFCAHTLREVTTLLERGLQDNATSVKALFRAERVENDGDFLFLMADAAALAIQYGHPAELCGPLIKAKTTGANLLEAYATYVQTALYEDFGVDPVTYSREYLKDPRPGFGQSGPRLWWYQVCTEFGFFQNAPGEGSIRSKQVNMTYHLNLCEELFGKGTIPDVNSTNLYYGGKDIAGSRIYFSNGSQDPWRHASKQQSSLREPSYLISCNNCGHGTDFRGCPQAPAQQEGDTTRCEVSSHVIDARIRLLDHLRNWLTANPVEGLESSLHTNIA